MEIFQLLQIGMYLNQLFSTNLTSGTDYEVINITERKGKERRCVCHNYHENKDKPLERIMGIEPTLLTWKAKVLPLNYIRKWSG